MLTKPPPGRGRPPDDITWRGPPSPAESAGLMADAPPHVMPESRAWGLEPKLAATTETRCSALWDRLSVTLHIVLIDLRRVRCRSVGLLFAFFIWTGLLLTGLGWLVLQTSVSIFGWPASYCAADGSFSPYFDYDLWKASGFFQVTFGFGKLTFTQAKIVDIVWDIAVGRGGQLLLGFYTWRAFSNYAAASAQTDPITYRAYKAVFISRESTVLSTCHLAYDFAARGGFRDKVAMVFMTVSLAFVLAFPTLASAMTGYRPNLQAFVLSVDGDFIPYSSFYPVMYVIHDGARVNLTQDYPVPWWNKNFDSYMYRLEPSSYFIFYDDCRFESSGGYKNSTSSELCSLQFAVSNYVSAYGFFGLNKTESTWMGQKLLSPVLNVSAFNFQRPSGYYASDIWEPYGYNWTDPRTGSQPFTEQSIVPQYTARSSLYAMTYIQKQGRCQPLDTFQWGFSYLQLFTVMLILIFWTGGAYFMWIKAHLTLKARNRTQLPHGYGPIMYLAEAIQGDLKDAGDSFLLQDDRKLERHIRESLKGGHIMLPSDGPSAPYSMRKSLGASVKRHKWGFSFMIAYTLFCALAWMGMLVPALGYVYFAAVLTWPCTLFTLLVGSTARSTVVLMLCGVVVGLLLAIPIANFH